MITTAAAVLPHNKGQGQLQEPQQAPGPSSNSSVQWNAPVLTKKVGVILSMGAILNVSI